MIRSLLALLADLARAAVLVAADHIAEKPIPFTPTDDADLARQMFAEQLDDDALVAEYLTEWEEA